MFYSIRHLTKFRYSASVSESIMELRMQPRSEGLQRCLSFQLDVAPRTRVQSYRDYLGNVVHHFDVPSAHRHMTIIAEATVDVTPAAPLPPQLGQDAWGHLDSHLQLGDFWELLSSSQYAHWTRMIEGFAQELDLPSRDEARTRDPLHLVSGLNTAIYRSIAYVPKSTSVNSTVDHALESRRGVCQDYAHIMIALVRSLGIPSRYVSGYLFHRAGETLRSTEGATHAWVEVYFPNLGWVGFDPTNNILAGETHVRTAVGRDYADVPPTRGVFKGSASSELTVAVRVAPSDKVPPPETEMESEDWSAVLQEKPDEEHRSAEQQQQ
jgi:transglutaminase-like putative cysteine protease